MSQSQSVLRDRLVPLTRRRTASCWRSLASCAVLAMLLPGMSPAYAEEAGSEPPPAAAPAPGDAELTEQVTEGEAGDVEAGDTEAGDVAAGAAEDVEAADVAQILQGVASLEEILGETNDPLGRIERQIEAEEFTPAIQELEQQIHEIEAVHHRFDQRLVRPLTLLGDAHVGLGEYDTALGHYQRALHLSRVNLGLNTPEQVEIVYREAEIYKVLGDLQQANDREEYAYHVLNRVHDPMDEDLLPGIYHLARWYERTSNVFAARALYEQAVQIIDAHHKLETVEAIPALRGIATSYRMEKFPPNYMSDTEPKQPATVVTSSSVRQPISVNNFPAGEAALQRVIRIRQDHQEEDPISLAKAVLDLADWYTLFDKPRRAEPLYAHAWEIMSDVTGFDVAGYFAEPELLYFPAPGNPSPPPAEERGQRITGYVEVAFDVTPDGYVRGLSTVSAEPQGLMEFRVRKSLRVARYRPMLVDGVPVPKQAHTYRHEFPYFEQREEAPQTAAASAGS